MNKKLLAVAVAGVFAAPVAALAQSSVTISGLIKGGFESQSMGSFSPLRAAGANKSTTGVVDDSSSIVFTVLEDLGNGMQAEARLDFRPSIDSGGSSAAANNVNAAPNALLAAGGNTHLGLKSKQWGTFFFGRQDLHYFNTESNITDKGSLRASPIALLSYVANTTNAAGAGKAVVIANGTRTPNVVYYKTPDFGPFWMIVAYSSSVASPTDGDIGVVGRKGRAWNINPNFSGANWQVGYSYWTSKADGGVQGAGLTNTVSVGDQRSDRLYGSYVWGGFKIGGAWDKSRVNLALSGVQSNNRTAWSIPASYTWGPHSVHAVYTKANNDKAAVNAGLDTRSSEWAMAYAYELSKRTSVALSYARINNHANADYFLFASTSLGLDNAGNAAGNSVGSLPGEKPTMWGVTLRHAF